MYLFIVAGYEECKEEAEPFDMENVNERFQSWEIPIAELSEYEEDEFRYEDDEEDDIALFDMFSEDFEEKLEEVVQLRQELEEESRKYFGAIDSLEDILSQYRKNDLLNIAKQLGLTNYGKWKKADFLKEILKTLLQVDCMQKMIKEAEQDEVELFEGAIEENGICISKEVVEDSWFLCCYGAFIEEAEFYLVPLDVQNLYEKAMTPEFRRALEDEAEFKSICDSALYLYGVISLSKFTEIYNFYAQTPLSEAMIVKKLKIYKKENTDIAIRGDYLMHTMLLEEDLYKDVLEFQDNLEPYLPQEKEEFLEYGEYDCQQPDADTEFFVNYLQNALELSYPQAMIYFYAIQEMVRMNRDDEEIMEPFMDKLHSPKAWKKAETMVNRFAKSVRKWDFCGHTFYEVHQQNKIIEFPTKSKIYPNDPCPCGSGKKYKHCCAKK